ncbi:hypothetical protein SDC9_191226 [bioreactor metagenome]|uniref:Uncharacterized protein n=1 Tax=bioreactor metagenome TaxID=1076179 RepID=A0A645HYK0_9ZZZZ
MPGLTVGTAHLGQKIARLVLVGGAARIPQEARLLDLDLRRGAATLPQYHVMAEAHAACGRTKTGWVGVETCGS